MNCRGRIANSPGVNLLTESPGQNRLQVMVLIGRNQKNDLTKLLKRFKKIAIWGGFSTLVGGESAACFLLISA